MFEIIESCRKEETRTNQEKFRTFARGRLEKETVSETGTSGRPICERVNFIASHLDLPL